MFVRDNRDQTARDRQADIFADHMRITFIRRVHRDRHIGKHRFRPCGGNANKATAVF